MKSKVEYMNIKDIGLSGLGYAVGIFSVIIIEKIIGNISLWQIPIMVFFFMITMFIIDSIRRKIK